jgi:hypothetical protein
VHQVITKAGTSNCELLSGCHNLNLLANVSLKRHHRADANGEAEHSLAPLESHRSTLVLLNDGSVLTETQDPLEIVTDVGHEGAGLVAMTDSPDGGQVIRFELLVAADEGGQLRLHEVSLGDDLSVTRFIGVIRVAVEALVGRMNQRNK